MLEDVTRGGAILERLRSIRTENPIRITIAMCLLGLLSLIPVQKTLCADINRTENARLTLVFRSITDTSGETSRQTILESGMKNVGNTFMLCLMEHLQATNKFIILTESDYQVLSNQPEDGVDINLPTKPNQNLYYVDGAITNVNHVIKKTSIIDPETFAAIVLKKEYITIDAVISLSKPATGETIFSEEVQGEAQIKKILVDMSSSNSGAGTEITDERVTDLYKAMCFASINFGNLLLESYPIEGKIIEIIKRGRLGIVDLGSDIGISTGDKFDVIEVRYRVAKGEIVGDEELIGECIVESVIDGTHCEVKRVSGALPIDCLVRFKGFEIEEI